MEPLKRWMREGMKRVNHRVYRSVQTPHDEKAGRAKRSQDIPIRFSPAARNRLEKFFRKNNYPSKMNINELAKEIGVRAKSVNYWFGNRRRHVTQELQEDTDEDGDDQMMDGACVSDQDSISRMSNGSVDGIPINDHIQSTQDASLSDPCHSNVAPTIDAPQEEGPLANSHDSTNLDGNGPTDSRADGASETDNLVIDSMNLLSSPLDN